MNHSAATGTGRDMMDGNKLNELRELVEFLKANDIAEFDMEQDDLKVRIKFAGEPAVAAAPTGGIDLAQLSRLMAAAPAAPAATPVHAVAPAASAAVPALRCRGRTDSRAPNCLPVARSRTWRRRRGWPPGSHTQ